MKKNFVLTAVMGLLVFAMSAAAQDKAVNFSGTWNLDVSKSKLSDRMPIESQTLTVTQTEKDIKIDTVTKHAPPPANAQQGMGMPGGKMEGGHMGGGQGRGGFGGPMSGDGTTTYSLDGKETKTDFSSPMGTTPVALKAKFDGSKLNLSKSMTMNGPMGEMTMTSKETWELSSDGKTLTVNTERNTPRGNESTTKVFAKN